MFQKGISDKLHKALAICYLMHEDMPDKLIDQRYKTQKHYQLYHFDWNMTLEGNDYWTEYAAGEEPVLSLSHMYFNLFSYDMDIYKKGELKRDIHLRGMLRMAQGIFIRKLLQDTK